jgi:hypothetical protein
MTRNNADFHGSVDTPISEVNEFIPSDYDDGNHSDPIRMKHVDRESCQNYHSHNEGYQNQLKADIAKNGIKRPVEASKLANGETLLLEGHHRVMIAKELGMSHVPVVFK